MSMAGNALLAVIKWFAGYFGNSFALIADAIESTTDIFSSLLVVLGFAYAKRPADLNHPYGHGRAETLVTFLVVGFLVASATIIAYQSIINIGRPHTLPEPYTLAILGAIIFWKELSYRWVLRSSRKTKSSALKADAWHHRSDAITSLAAFAGISLAIIMGEGWESADDWAALLASFVIVYNAYRIFRPALGEIMDEHSFEDLVEEIRIASRGVEGVRDTEKCFIRKAGMKFHVDLHVHVDGEVSVRRGHEIAHALKDHLHQSIQELGHISIHVEPYG
ncbi:MAG: cation transporter [Saprospiraceae bacterium]|nr:cation transporter [Saprospiraceae bacterium]MBP9210547.1 cation transporter [Saprospiraceae bacterium]